MQKLLESSLASMQGASSKGNVVAAAIGERNLEKVRTLLNASPDLLHAGDERSNQPIHWAVNDAADRLHRRPAGARRGH